MTAIHLDHNAGTPIAPEVGMGAIRFSLGRNTTQEEVEAVVETLARSVASADV